MGTPDQETKREDLLRSLMLVTSLLSRARSTNDKYVYRSVFEFARSIEKYFSHTPMMHYILGVTRLNGWGDQEYARQKYQVITTLRPAFSLDLAATLKGEIDRGALTGAGEMGPVGRRTFRAAALPVL